MYHSITFDNEKNTWDDWHLIPSSRPLVVPPSIKSNYVDVAGIDGGIDLSDYPTSRPTYNYREGSWEFIVMNGYEDWVSIYQKVMNYLYGIKRKVMLEDDPNYYYEGRVWVNQWKSGSTNSSITLNYKLEPYKKDAISSTDPWLWDPFNFETGIIRYSANIEVDGTRVVTIDSGSIQRIIPTFVSSSAMAMTYKGTTYNLVAGNNQFLDIIIDQAVAEFTFKGTGTVTIQYRGGVL